MWAWCYAIWAWLSPYLLSPSLVSYYQQIDHEHILMALRVLVVLIRVVKKYIFLYLEARWLNGPRAQDFQLRLMNALLRLGGVLINPFLYLYRKLTTMAYLLLGLPFFQNLRRRLTTVAYLLLPLRFFHSLMSSTMRLLAKNLTLIRSWSKPYLPHFRALLGMGNILAMYSPKFRHFQLAPGWLWLCELLAGEDWMYLAFAFPLTPLLDWSFEYLLSPMPFEWRAYLCDELGNAFWSLKIFILPRLDDILLHRRNLPDDRPVEVQLQRLQEFDQYWASRKSDLFLIAIFDILELADGLRIRERYSTVMVNNELRDSRIVRRNGETMYQF